MVNFWDKDLDDQYFLREFIYLYSQLNFYNVLTGTQTW
jgi:hypothetical protein